MYCEQTRIVSEVMCHVHGEDIHLTGNLPQSKMNPQALHSAPSRSWVVMVALLLLMQVGQRPHA